VKHLRNNECTPAHVITRLGTTMRQFKVGAPVPVVTFKVVARVDGAEETKPGGENGTGACLSADSFETADSEEAWGE